MDLSPLPMPAHDIDYRLIGDDLQIVEIELDPHEAVRAEAGAMLYRDEHVRMDTGTGGGFMKGLKRRITGESFFITSFANEGSRKARVAFSAPYPGKVIPLDLSALGGRFLCQKDTFLCAADGIEIEVAFTKKIGAGLFGGEGFILQRLEGDGLAFCHAGGTIVERDPRGRRGALRRHRLPGRLRRHRGLRHPVPGRLQERALRRRGAVPGARRGGRGLVYLQSLPFSPDWRTASSPPAGCTQTGARRTGGGAGALGAIGGLAAGGLLGDILGGDS